MRCSKHAGDELVYDGDAQEGLQSSQMCAVWEAVIAQNMVTAVGKAITRAWDSDALVEPCEHT